MARGSSWLCPTESDRARVLDNSARVRRARLISAGAIGVAMFAMGPFLGWSILLLFAAAMVNFTTLEWRLARSDRPERVAAGSLLYTEAVIATGVAVTGAGDSHLLPWMAVPLGLAAARFRPRVVVVGGVVALGMLVVATVGVDPASVGDPTLILVTLALGVSVTATVLALESAELHHRSQSVLDPLTGLLNRKALTGRFGEIAEQARLSGASVCMLALDLDGFKRVNDEHGHARGDIALRDAAYEMRKSLRQFELFYRYGGEEFLVVLPGVTLAAGKHVAERLRASVEAARPGGLELTVSVGVAAAEGDAVEFQALFARADTALYEAKQRGRNLVVLAAGGDGAGARRGPVPLLQPACPTP